MWIGTYLLTACYVLMCYSLKTIVWVATFVRIFKGVGEIIFPQHKELTQSCRNDFNQDNTFTKFYTELQKSLNPYHTIAEIKSYESSFKYRVAKIKIATIERSKYNQINLPTMKQSKTECCGKNSIKIRELYCDKLYFILWFKNKTYTFIHT